MRWTDGATIRFLACKPCGEGALFFARKPARIGWFVIEVPEFRDPQRHGQQSFDEKHRLPALQSGPWRHLKQNARERTADDKRNWNAEIEESENFAAHATRKPIGEIQNCAGKEARFQDAENEPQYVERRAAA